MTLNSRLVLTGTVLCSASALLVSCTPTRAADNAPAPATTAYPELPQQEPPPDGSIMPRPEEDTTGPKPGPDGVTQGSARRLAPGRTVQRTIPGTAVDYMMVYVPRGRVAVFNEDGERVEVDVGPFWIGQSELTWDMYDVFVFNLDQPGENPEADAVSRPSRPYIPPDRGFGHGGYPAISMTTQGATKFCEWLSKKTGRRYRLPTVAEWRYAALAGSAGPYCFGEGVEQLDAFAWYASNSNEKTHPCGQKKPNAWGLFDVHGNVMEWCTDGKGWVACGGSWKDEAEAITAFSVAEQDWEWNMTDPQIPKSPWWLSDASWVGMRLICEDEMDSHEPKDQP